MFQLLHRIITPPLININSLFRKNANFSQCSNHSCIQSLNRKTPFLTSLVILITIYKGHSCWMSVRKKQFWRFFLNFELFWTGYPKNSWPLPRQVENVLILIFTSIEVDGIDKISPHFPDLIWSDIRWVFDQHWYIKILQKNT